MRPSSAIRELVLRVSGHPWLRRAATQTRPGRALAGRFVAGETLEDAMQTASELRTRGLTTLLDLLGEDVATNAQAEAARDAYLEAIERAASADGLDCATAIKPTQLGLVQGLEPCWRNVAPILDAAAAHGIRVELDMEAHPFVEGTLAVLARGVDRHPDLGVALQAYLHRTVSDVFALPPDARVRLVKGAYLEPADVALRDKAEVDRAWARLFVTLLDRGHRVDAATHDERLLEGVRRRLADRPEASDRVEFQMLYGVRRDLQAQLAGQGYPVRIYLPYGTEWYPYLTRRLAERPANLWFFASNLLRRDQPEKERAQAPKG